MSKEHRQHRGPGGPMMRGPVEKQKILKEQ